MSLREFSLSTEVAREVLGRALHLQYQLYLLVL